MKIYDGIIVVLLFCCLSSVSVRGQGLTADRISSIFGENNLGAWNNGIIDANLAPGPEPDGPPKSLVLAASRTNRPDILRGFKHYQDGWDIGNRHYFSSVAFTGAFGFILAVVWFVTFGLIIVVYLFLGWRMNIKGKISEHANKICLIMLLIFTSATAIGCILLSVGQGDFHGEVFRTVKFVVSRSDYTVQTLRNVTEYLSLAKNISVAHVFLPSDVMSDIDKLDMELSTAANTIEEKTRENSKKIRRVFNIIRSVLISVAAIMLVLSLLGLVLSVLGHQHAIYIFIVSGWLLVAITFVLCGAFVIFNNMITDTCVAMEEWVANPRSESALSNVLPCVDQRTTNQTLYKSKLVVNDIVSVVNQYIYTYANTYPPKGTSYYYNQSGASMPALCYPYDDNLQDRQCTSQEVSIANASEVWKYFTCQVSEMGVCITPGKVTPVMYAQLVAAVNESYALQHYTPPLLSFQDCNFVRDAFLVITGKYCPLLERNLKIVDAGLGLISAGVMLCLILWILYANRPQREAEFVGSQSCANKTSTKPCNGTLNV
ncbi:unnamed protein product [Rhodiola kirilowii]